MTRAMVAGSTILSGRPWARREASHEPHRVADLVVGQLLPNDWADQAAVPGGCVGPVTISRYSACSAESPTVPTCSNDGAAGTGGRGGITIDIRECDTTRRRGECAVDHCRKCLCDRHGTAAPGHGQHGRGLACVRIGSGAKTHSGGRAQVATRFAASE